MTSYPIDPAPQSRGVAAAPAHGDPPLAGRDLVFLVAFWMAALWALDPAVLHLEYRSGWKHVPLLVFTLAVIFAFICRQLEVRSSKVDLRALVPTIPISILGVWIIAGSLYQRFTSTIDNSFLNMGLTMLMASATIWVAVAARAPWKWLDAHFIGVATIAFVTGCVQVALMGRTDVFHGHEYLVIPFAIWAWYRFERLGTRVLVAGTFLVFGFAALKNTAYLTILLTLLYFLIVTTRAHWPRMDAARRSLLTIGLLVALTVLAAVVLYVYARRDELLPTGNTTFRTFTYWRAWLKFLDSPLVGTSFTGPSSEFFPLYTVATSTQILPTHSDFLDILANGGVIGFVIWIAAMTWMLLRGVRIALSGRSLDRRQSAVLHFSILSSLSALLTCLFNPVLQYPSSGWTYWTLFATVVVASRLLVDPPLRAGAARAAGPSSPRSAEARTA